MPIDLKSYKDDNDLDHQFWTKLGRDPKMQYRFLVHVGGMGLEDARNEEGNKLPGADTFADQKMPGLSNGNLWYAKSIDKPGLDLPDDQQEVFITAYQKANPRPRVGSPIYKPITMTLVDPYYPNVTRKVARLFRRGGLNDAAARNVIKPGGNSDDFAKSFIDSCGPVNIYQLNEDGKIIENWTLYQAYPDKVDFGKLDYSSSDLVEITLTWYYSAFTVKFPSIGKEKYFEYFPDAALSGAELEQLIQKGNSKEAREANCTDKYNGYKQGKKPNEIMPKEAYFRRHCPEVADFTSPVAPTPPQDDSSSDAQDRANGVGENAIMEGIFSGDPGNFGGP